MRALRLGYTRGTVPAMELKTPSTALRLVQSIGTAALLVLLFDLFFRIGARWRTILLVVGVLGFAALSVLKPSLFRLLLSMSGGIVMPSLVAVGLCRELMERERASHTCDSAAPRLHARRFALGYRCRFLRLAACDFRALAAFLYDRNGALSRREDHAASFHRALHSCVSRGIRL